VTKYFLKIVFDWYLLIVVSLLLSVYFDCACCTSYVVDIPYKSVYSFLRIISPSLSLLGTLHIFCIVNWPWSIYNHSKSIITPSGCWVIPHITTTVLVWKKSRVKSVDSFGTNYQTEQKSTVQRPKSVQNIEDTNSFVTCPDSKFPQIGIIWHFGGAINQFTSYCLEILFPPSYELSDYLYFLETFKIFPTDHKK
jgi:hypothetical protein